MKFFQPLQCAVYIAIAGLLILALTLYIETLPISFEGTTIIASSTSNLTIYSFLGGLAILIIFVFSFLSYMSYTILNNYALMNEALKASENRFRAIFEKAPVGIALSEPLKGVIIAANSTYLETVGLTKNDMNTSNWLQNTHPDDLEKSLEYNKMLDENKIKGFKQSKKYIHADGSVVWANLNVSSIKIDDKTPANRLVIIENITEQKKTERELINSQRNLEEAQRLAKIGSWEYKIATKETKWSKEFYNVLELDEKSTTNIIAAYKAICNPKDLENIDEQIKIATATGASFSYEHSVTCKSGNIKHLLCIGETLKNAEGKVIGFRGTEQDITEMKKMQALLKTKEQNASLIRYAAQVPGAMYQFRFFPNGKFEFPFVSDGAKELCGYTPEEIMADVLKAFYLVHPDDFELLLQSVQQSMERLEYWQHDFRIVLPETGIKWIRGNAKPERLEDGSILWHGYFNDISESKQAEETLKINKSKLEVVFNGSNSAIMLLTRERFFDCNPQTLEMFGLSNRSEFIECHPSDLSPELQPDGQNSFSKANQMIEIAFEKGVNRFEWIHKRKDGSPFPAEVLLSAFNYGNERVLQAAVTDITERKKAEKKILENEALLTSILQTLPVAVFGKDVQRNFSFSVWNKKAEEIFGVKAEDCIGKTDYDFFSKKDADWFRFNDLKACETYKEVNIPEEIVETANKKAIVRTKKTIVKGVNDEPLIILGVSEDISEQKKAEQELKRSEEKYRSVVESAADIILTADKDFIINTVNRVRLLLAKTYLILFQKNTINK
jgi:PAS domain S-box-containing protein